MSKTLERVRTRPHVAFVDDERSIGNSIIVTLAEGYCFKVEKGCGVRGYDTVKEVTDETRAVDVYKVQPNA